MMCTLSSSNKLFFSSHLVVERMHACMAPLGCMIEHKHARGRTVCIQGQKGTGTLFSACSAHTDLLHGRYLLLRSRMADDEEETGIVFTRDELEGMQDVSWSQVSYHLDHTQLTVMRS